MKVRKTIMAIGIILLMEAIILLCLSVVRPETAAADEYGSSSTEPVDAKDAINAGKVNNFDGKYQTEREIYEENRKCLVLVNAKTALDESYEVSLTPICRGRVQVSEQMHASLVKMLKDAGKKGYHFWIASGWRSREKQKALVEEDIRKEMRRGASYKKACRLTYQETMPPGYSEHETGLALDILCQGNMNMDISQEKEEGNRWLRKNCHRYGFILRYPKGKKKETGINYEPWHFRYVGEKASKYMNQQKMTLEEFWSRLDKS